MYFPVAAWLPAFAATLAIEAPIIGFAFRHVARGWVALAIVFVFANLATHLAVWYIATQLLLPGSLPFIVAAEAWAFAGEALVFWAAIPGLSPVRAVATAAVANIASATLGLAVAWIQ